ncbi:hypothetical protein UH38_22000 [Aliterella atlantica CENA595]|uniref:Uncharacterized protein n=2 Tax=Aliterella TaxID=1827277 RepID=A0A0D8ZM26_9CYAN|nr:hypothetical protein UH38_22000 [Aliterella atlantica CENA595]
MTQLTEVQTVEAVNNQVSTPKTWDRATTAVNIGDRICIPFTPIMEVVDKDVYLDGRVWLLVKPNSGSYTEEWVLDAEDEVQQPLFKEETEYKQGFEHGKLDAAKRLPPICAQAECQYSKGYLKGYSSTPTPQQTKTPTAPSWVVRYDGEYWYKVWVGDRIVGKASTHEKAEQLAQKAIASKKFQQEHRERVLAAYAG